MQVQTQRKKAIFSPPSSRLLIPAHRGENPRQEAKIRSATSPPPMAKNMPRNTRDAQLFLPHSPQCTQGTCKPDSHVPLNQGNKRLCLKHTLLPIHLKKEKKYTANCTHGITFELDAHKAAAHRHKGATPCPPSTKTESVG